MRENRRAALAMIGDEGWPYAVPVNFYYDEAEDRIYFHGALSTPEFPLDGYVEVSPA